jgi:hypothetical protein
LDSDVDVATDLADCSPFYNMDGRADLTFDVDKGVVTETIGGAARTSRADSSAPSVQIVGAFRAVGQTSRVTVALGGVSHQYTLVMPTDGDQCILAMGEATAVDLSRSWFGTDEEDPGPQDDSATTRA